VSRSTSPFWRVLGARTKPHAIAPAEPPSRHGGFVWSLLQQGRVEREIGVGRECGDGEFDSAGVPIDRLRADHDHSATLCPKGVEG
jgi:hypothetical protein